VIASVKNRIAAYGRCVSFNSIGMCTPKLVDVNRIDGKINLEEPYWAGMNWLLLSMCLAVKLKRISSSFGLFTFTVIIYAWDWKGAVSCSAVKYVLLSKISMASGFISTPHFSRCLSQHIGVRCDTNEKPLESRSGWCTCQSEKGLRFLYILMPKMHWAILTLNRVYGFCCLCYGYVNVDCLISNA